MTICSQQSQRCIPIRVKLHVDHVDSTSTDQQEYHQYPGDTCHRCKCSPWFDRFQFEDHITAISSRQIVTVPQNALQCPKQAVAVVINHALQHPCSAAEKQQAFLVPDPWQHFVTQNSSKSLCRHAGFCYCTHQALEIQSGHL